ncbi:condensation domain-containing protein [Nostoc sp.]|uniref:condensation domain-containing protein n=1 Tax=Nostoc sp. TaxID=1180 RepID=UPI002FFBC5D4
MNKKDIEAIYPLSPAQQGMLFGTLSAPNSGIHIEQTNCVLQGTLNVQAFEQAWQWVVNRHSILRTAFVWKNQDEPRQVVFRQVIVTINSQDWRKLEPSEQQKQLEDYLKADRQQGFDFSKPPLMRFALFRVSDDSYQFVWSHHHISIDGWCLFIILNEVLASYQAIVKNEDIHLKPTRPYKDYITWLRQQDLVAAEKFWQHTLQGFTQPTTLGQIAQPDNLSDSLAEGYSQQEILLSASTTNLLKSLAQEHKITLNTLIQGVWALLLSRYATSADVLFGITVSGRSADVVGIDSMIGLFINTLPLRIKVAPQESFWAWLQNIHTHNEEIRQYEYSSAGQVHQWSEVSGALPLYESLLVFQNYPSDYSILRSTNLDISVHQVSSQGAQTQYPLTLMVTVDSECKFCLVYDKSRLNSVNINLILKHLLELVQNIVQDTKLNLATLLNQIPAEQIPQISPRNLKNVISIPRTPLEEILVNIWTEVLKLDNVDIHENFFELGGHSLLATQLISRINKTFDIELQLRLLFEFPTVAKLAKSIEDKKLATKSVLPIERVSREIQLPLSFAQKRLWFLYKLDPNSYLYNGSSAILLQGPLNIKALEQTINEIVRRHEILRTCFQIVIGQPVQLIVPDLKIPLPILDLQNLPEVEHEAEVEKIRRVDYKKPFDLTQAPLFRLTLLRFKTREYILLVTMHHIISDAWSEGVFIREVSVLYEAFSSGKPSPLTEMDIQYADFATWQQNWLQGEVFDTLIRYWEKQLGDNLPVLQLPKIRQTSKLKNSQEKRQTLILPKTLSQGIKKLSNSLGTTLFMTLLGAFKVLLYWYTGDKDIVVGTDIANRNKIEVENLIGFFVNQLVLRSNLYGNPTFSEFLQQLRKVCLEAYAHQDLPFEKLVSALNPKRDLNQTPLFQVKFILQNAPIHPLALSDLTLTRLDDLENTIARFDLLLELTDTEQGIVGLLKYNKDLLDASSIARLLNSFEAILSQIVVNPAIRLNQLEEMIIQSDKEYQLNQEGKRKEKSQQRLSIIKRKVIDIVTEVEE